MNPKSIAGLQDLYRMADAHPRAPAATERMLALASACPHTSETLFGGSVLTLFPEKQPCGSLTKNVAKLKEARMQGTMAMKDLLASLGVD